MHNPITVSSELSVRRRLAGVLMIAALCGMAGCGDDEGHPVPADITSSRSTTPPVTTPRTTTTTAAPTPTALPEAADGTNLDACVDGNCEVQIDGPTVIPISVPGRLDSLEVEAITATSVTLKVIMGSGTRGNATTGVGGTINFNGVVIRPIAIKDGSVVLSVATS
ncbi:hypothetical protein [Nocardia sp. NPDC052566]|uniref:hypothetical protein n=1 Tax=Nocardia sp. NPDC052566 TaxID=3364330 RepID=UPI0037C65877